MNPIIAAILADPGIDAAFQSGVALAEPDQSVLPVRRAHYVAALLRHDWLFEQADDLRSWRRGRNELQRLRSERAVVDPDGSLWRKHAPEEFHS